MKKYIYLFFAFFFSHIWLSSSFAKCNLDKFGINTTAIYGKTGKTAPNSYAVIINGGGDHKSNWESYWNDCAMTYQFLTNIYGFDKNHIDVIMADGMNSSHAETLIAIDTITDARRSDAYTYDNVSEEYGYRNGLWGKYRYYCLDAPHRYKLDGSQNPQILEASMSNIESVFNKLSKINNIDELYIFVTDHGFSGSHEIVLWNNVALSHDKFASLVNSVTSKSKSIMLTQCFSGSYIKPLKKYDNRTICTATSKDKSSWSGSFNCFFCKFYDALSGKNHTNDASVNADYNKDGKVSYEEAFVYAKDHDGNSDPTKSKESWYEIPRFWSSETDYRFCRDTYIGVAPTIGEVYGTKNEDAMYLINLNGLIHSNANITLSSGKTIRFEKGFKTQKGAHLLAQLFDCEAEKRQNPDELRKKYLAEEEEIAEEVTEESVASIEVAPNPSNGIFIVTLGETETDITLMDIQGRVLKSYNRVSGNFEIDITDAPNGMYLMVLASDSFKITRKIVKY
ncbi:MAG: T9SS type A sorting domain-containing protein [Paludibacteraceae bacterium]|nr:T9SS type A sorting domain-containing protein [Paludibacteraceae bacterium]